jgi:hypothetical protein
MSGISPSKKMGPRNKKKQEQGFKSKRVKSHLKTPCFKRRKEKKDEIDKLLGEILSKERKKGDHIFL